MVSGKNIRVNSAGNDTVQREGTVEETVDSGLSNTSMQYEERIRTVTHLLVRRTSHCSLVQSGRIQYHHDLTQPGSFSDFPM